MTDSKNIYANSKTENYISVYNKICSEMVYKIKTAEFNKNLSHNFIVQMIPHHRAIIDMYENILKHTANVKLQDISYNMISTQKRNMSDLKNILCYCGDISSNEKDLKAYKERSAVIIGNMLKKMENAEVTQNLNCTFIREIIPCHNGVIEMCQNAVKYPLCNGLKPIISNIVSTQNKAIKQTKILMRGMGCKL